MGVGLALKGTVGLYGCAYITKKRAAPASFLTELIILMAQHSTVQHLLELDITERTMRSTAHICGLTQVMSLHAICSF